MSKKRKFVAFLVFLLFFLLLVLLANFVRYHVFKDFDLYTFTACDPNNFSCFVTDPDFTGFSFYSEPYAKVEIAAAIAPSCLDEHTCENFSCNDVGEQCLVMYCATDLLEEGEICTDDTNQ